MDEPRATCGDLKIIEEPRPVAQDLGKVTGVTVVTSSDVHGAKQSKKVENQSLHKTDNVSTGTSYGGLQDMDETELETLRVDSCISSPDFCIGIPEDLAKGGPTIGDHAQHGSSQPVDRVDLLYSFPKTSFSGSQVGDEQDPEQNLKGNVTREPRESSKLLVEEDHTEQECPICTELYDSTKHKQSLLNCNHIFCDNCIKTMVNTATHANVGRVTCPICRQTTPMVEWEVRKMQEQMMESGGVCTQHGYSPVPALVRRPGLCGALEYRFHKRFRTGRICLCPSCSRNPQRLMNGLTRLEQRCRCLYLTALLFLLFAEFFCFTFLFMPIFVFILIIILGK